MIRLILSAFLAAGLVLGQIRLNQLEYFEAPGFSFHPYHNDYRGGYMSGLQMIQHGARLLDSGDLYLEPKPGAPPLRWTAERREADPGTGAATVTGSIEGVGEYSLITRTDGRRIFVTLRLSRAPDWNRVQAAGLRFALFPGAYYGKSFQGEAGAGVFPQQYTGEARLLGPTARVVVAQEDPLVKVAFAREGGTLILQDNRRSSPQPWFTLLGPLEPGSAQTEVRLTITPNLVPSWHRTPVVGVSQVGYHPNQPKRVVLELDPREKPAGEVKIWRLTLDGEKQVAASGAAKPWGKFLRWAYATFDFSSLRDLGLYVAEYAGQTAGPFRIAADVYDGAWKPALTYFLPIQMCHVAVREGTRTWHGACHLDDARQAPAGTRYIDSYEQAERETRFADNEHIPGLNWGGWHDAGDLDLPTGSIASTTLALTLAQEEFRPRVDDYTFLRDERLVELHRPDGKSDLLQQIEFGVEGLLVSFRVGGHIFPGIIESTGRQYSHLGDPVNVTDNQLCPKPGPGCDDRWVFTNRNTGLQYQTAQTLAAASRVMKEFNSTLAAEALAAARKLFADEQSRPPVYAPSAYAPRDSGFRTQEIAAAAELLLTTGEERYHQRLVELVPQIEQMPALSFGGGPAAALARAWEKLRDPKLRGAVEARAKEFAALQTKLAASSPYGVPFPSAVGTHEGTRSRMVWGSGWSFQSAGVHNYFLHRRWPALFGKELSFAVADYVLGVHPASNESLASGVGARSPLIAYGTNRADWSHIPGGVISGPSLIRPDFYELKRFPFLWYQTEYVIHGAATYIFDLLAAQSLAAVE